MQAVDICILLNKYSCYASELRYNYAYDASIVLLFLSGNNRRDRSRSPTRVDSVGRRRDSKLSQDGHQKTGDMSNNVMSQMMMANMYQQGRYNSKLLLVIEFVWYLYRI